MEETKVILLQHGINQIRDFFFDTDKSLIIRQFTVNPNGLEAAIRAFRLTEPEYRKIAELISLLESKTQAAGA